MFLFGNLLYAIATIIAMVLQIAQWLIIIRALISWVNPDPYNPIVQFLYKSTEPILEPLRRFMPTYSIGIDLSPLLAILLIYFIRLFVVASLFTLAARLM